MVIQNKSRVDCRFVLPTPPLALPRVYVARLLSHLRTLELRSAAERLGRFRKSRLVDAMRWSYDCILRGAAGGDAKRHANRKRQL